MWIKREGLTRRELLGRAGLGFGMAALAHLLGEEGLLEAAPAGSSPSGPHHVPRARSVIWLFMEGGPSGFDLFDPKPELDRAHGKRLEGVEVFFGRPGPLLRSPYRFRRHGRCGAWVCEKYPALAECVDDIAFIKSVHAESNSHAPAMFQMNTGVIRPGFPSAGAWVTYGLGTENRNLPGFVVLGNRIGTKGGPLNWGAGFLPSSYQGTVFRTQGTPVLNLARPADVSVQDQRAQLDLLGRLNEEHLRRHPDEEVLRARIESFELAYRMQTEALEAVDLSRETEETRRLYGLDREETRAYGEKLLLARRLVERGVRFVQAYVDDQWDAHENLKKNHDARCEETDVPIAGLLKDLKRRGLLETTLVVWGGEFGRMPVSQGGLGRDHNPHGFLVWMAGGGVRGGTSYGELDELGYKIARDPVSVPDLHATILHLLGMDHRRLTYLHNGRRYRLTDVSGRVIEEILA
jgi:hypothetical protein